MITRPIIDLVTCQLMRVTAVINANYYTLIVKCYQINLREIIPNICLEILSD